MMKMYDGFQMPLLSAAIPNFPVVSLVIGGICRQCSMLVLGLGQLAVCFGPVCLTD